MAQVVMIAMVIRIMMIALITMLEMLVMLAGTHENYAAENALKPYSPKA